MTAKEYRARARQHLSGNWGILILAYVLYGVIVGAISCTGVGAIASLVLAGPFSVGIVGMYLSVRRTGRTEIGMLFDGFRTGLGNRIVGGILYTLFLMLWTFLFWVPGIIKTFSYAMTFYIMCDNPEMSGNDAITLSRKMMNGNKFRLFCLYFSFIGWMILSVFTFGIGYLFLYPYMSTATAEFYEDLKAQQEPLVTEEPQEPTFTVEV